MLRVMKQKVKSSVSEESSRQSGASSAREESLLPDSDDYKQQIPMVFANVPHSISVPWTKGPESSSSSISSEGLHIMAPLTRVSEDETTSGVRVLVTTEDSPTASSIQPGKKHTSTHPNGIQESSFEHTFARKVSTSEIDENESVPSAKRRRMSIDSTPATTAALPSVRLLAMPEDSSILNSLHTFCRMQIEVFTATPVDMAQPAPGRKTPIKLHQVGLRCIHCRHMVARDRVKRAVCYPRSVNRIYHSVSDMKFDHFSQCRGFSPDMRAKFEALREECKRRSERKDTNGNGGGSSTAQYYHDAACKMGLVDSKENDGIFMAGQVLDHRQLPASLVNEAVRTNTKPPSKSICETSRATTEKKPLVCDTILPKQPTTSNQQPPFPTSFPVLTPQVLAMYQSLQNCGDGSGGVLPNEIKVQQQPVPTPIYPPLNGVSAFSVPTQQSTVMTMALPSNDKMCLLAMPEDPAFLNGLHCFVRRNVEVFIATKEDASAPSPGRRTRVKVGQVGLRCIFCSRLPHKDRVKRAVCYPPSVGGIYHSVSNMKFDHFGNCKGLTPEARLEFVRLKSSSGRRNTPSSNGSRSGTSSTAQYYEESAARLGLIDGDGGIQFRNQDAGTIGSNGGESATDGISALMIAATNPTVRADFDRRKAALSSETATAKAVAAVQV